MTSNPSASYFEKVADQWDNLRSGYFTEAVRESAIQKAYLHPEMTVADVGAGTGFVTAGLAPLVKHVHVLDGSAQMLDVARKNLSAFQNLTFHEADGLSYVFRTTLSMRPLPICTCTTAPTRWLLSAKWCGFCAQVVVWC